MPNASRRAINEEKIDIYLECKSNDENYISVAHLPGASIKTASLALGGLEYNGN